MSLKSILVHVDDSASCRGRLDAAAKLARDFRAQLAGIYLVPTLQMAPTMAAMLPTEVVERRLLETGDAQRRAEDAFRNAAAAAGVASIDWRAPAGPPIEAAVAHGRCADLLVLGQPERDGEDFAFAEELVTTVMLSSGRPTLIVPAIGAPTTMGENALVAWDGGREAARAIGDALPLLERAKHVAIIAVEAEGAVRGRALAAETRLAAWLDQHGIKADVRRYPAPDIPIGEWMLSRAADAGSDLIVMGGYGHTRVRELVLGGVTRTMLQSMTVPVLMSH